jgi:hypothetical protein
MGIAVHRAFLGCCNDNPINGACPLRSSAQETRVRAETMRDAEARRMMHELAMQYENLAALIEKAVPRQDESR